MLVVSLHATILVKLYTIQTSSGIIIANIYAFIYYISNKEP